MPKTSISAKLIETSRRLCSLVEDLKFRFPVSVVYNPLRYAWSAHEAYLKRFGESRSIALARTMAVELQSCATNSCH